MVGVKLRKKRTDDRRQIFLIHSSSVFSFLTSDFIYLINFKENK
jgi:hypothetical protein